MHERIGSALMKVNRDTLGFKLEKVINNKFYITANLNSVNNEASFVNWIISYAMDYIQLCLSHFIHIYSKIVLHVIIL